jgi:hypothetical protein
MDPSLGVNLDPIVGQRLAALCLQEDMADIHFLLPRKEDPENFKVFLRMKILIRLRIILKFDDIQSKR